MKVRGFSLAELLIGLVLVTLLLGVGVTQLSGSRASADSRAVGQTVAAELIAARDQAISEQRPVAFCLPSEGGSFSHAQAYYVMVGEVQPVIARARRLSESDSPVCVFWGFWNLDGALLNDPGALNSIDAPPSSPLSSVNLTDWNATTVDPMFVFHPSGTVTTNDLVQFDGAWHLVVSHGVSYSPSGPPPGTPTVSTPPSYAILDEVHKPYTVTIDPTGAISVEAGVVAASTVTHSQHSLGPSPAVSVPVVPPPGSTPPVVDQVFALPVPAGGAPPGIDALVSQGGHLTLRIYATDADSGERLFSSWTPRFVSGAATGPGRMSSPGRQRLSYDFSLARWVGDWEWRPPASAQLGDEFALDATVYDDTGRVSAGGANAQIVLRITNSQKIVFEQAGEIWSIRPDGQGKRNLTNHPAADEAPSLSPDGQVVVFTSDRGGTRDLWIMNSDGSGLRQMTNLPGDEYGGMFSPTGNFLAYIYSNGGVREVRWRSVDGSTDQVVAAGAIGDKVSVAPDGETVAHDSSGGRLVTIRKVDPSDTRTLTLTGVDDPYWDPTPGTTARLAMDRGSRVHGYVVAEIDLAGMTSLSEQIYPDPHTNPLDDPVFSPDGSRLCYDSAEGGTGDLWTMEVDGSNPKLVVPGPVGRVHWAR